MTAAYGVKLFLGAFALGASVAVIPVMVRYVMRRGEDVTY